MKMMRLLVIVAAAQGSLGLVRQTTSRTQRSLPVAQDDNEEVVSVVEPDVIADESENAVKPTKALAQKAAKIAGNGGKVTPDSEKPAKALAQKVAKIMDSGVKVASDSNFYEAKISTGALSDASSSSDAKSDEVVEVTGATPDIVQAKTTSADEMPAKIEFEDDKEFYGDSKKVSQAKHEKSSRKRAAAVQVVAPKVKIAALAPAKSSGPKKDGRLRTVSKQLKALAMKKHLRGPETDDDGEEYVDPSQVQTVDDHQEEEFVPVVPGKMTNLNAPVVPVKMPNVETKKTNAPQPQVQKAKTEVGIKEGEVYEADAVDSLEAEDVTSKENVGLRQESAKRQDVAPTEKSHGDSPSDSDGDEYPSVDSVDKVEHRALEEASKPSHSCEEGSEFNNNDC